ncbi:DEAD/DEAH box helicase [Mucilaginibacter sp. HMF5004]|nr:DEAD/DEAH box helicase [Mucilaginibacter rivuli]
MIGQYAPAGFDGGGYDHFSPVALSIDNGVFENRAGQLTSVIQQHNKIILACNCEQAANRLCTHQAEVLLQIIKKDELRVFFDEKLRDQKLRKFAVDYGLEDADDIGAYFIHRYHDGRSLIVPVQAGLFPVSKDSLSSAVQLLIPDKEIVHKTEGIQIRRVIVIKQHKYYKHLQVELCDAPTTVDGGIKNPLTPVPPLELVWDSNDPFELKFFTAVSRFQQTINDKVSEQAITSLKAIVRNPLDMDCYMHDSEVSEKITASALQKVKLGRVTQSIEITVNKQGDFYEVSGKLKIGDAVLELKNIEVGYTYFVQLNNALYLVKDVAMLGGIAFFKRRGDNLLIHKTKFNEFKALVLNKLEESNTVNYPYIKIATLAQLKKSGFSGEPEKIIYLSDFGPYIMILPVMRIGEAEIPIRTTKQIFALDEKGKEFLVKRDDAAETRFMTQIIKQHTYFEEQIDDHLQYFYLHRKRFLDENWFLDAFEAWRNEGITILGFNELSGNKLNAEKINVSVQVLSGINWFNATVKARFGKRKASLKHLHKAIRNKTKFVQLDDGTLGVLPEEWIEKFTKYFTAGDVFDDETLRISKMNFESVSEMYERQMLDEEVLQQIRGYKKKLHSFDTIQNIDVPAGFNGTLRHYQQQGLNWLNFLDEFNFGGCLADDMGLGKTVQIIAFILSQRGKVSHNTNLLVVPTSLIFNWQAEIKKFAPGIKIHTIYGADRIKNTDEFGKFEVILTSYGTLLSDVNFLRHYEFNYIFLDESQNIKNPGSQRYKSVMLLKSRNRIVITGTPIENNTFDIYGQLSFACPGLLGSRQYFKDIYSTPIDKFKVSKRSRELQQKIKPFILRRAKDQVATELPEKTEMVLYCEMGTEQRGIYDAYEKEFREFIAATSQDELPKSSMHVLKGITRLRQICDSPLLLEGEKLPGSMSSKIETLIEQIESKSPQHKILVFSQFVTMLSLIKEELNTRGIQYSYLTGATRNREAEVNKFQNDADVRVFLISLKAGGTGLNLTAADYVYLVDPWWNPAIENQAIDRCYRIGQEKHVVAVRLICPDTIEDKMVHLQQNKKELANTLIHTDTSIFKSLTRDDLLGMLRKP